MKLYRRIAHLDLDAFYVSVERLNNKDLLNKPVIIGGSSDRGVVSTCSYEARQFGVHSAMSIVKAKQLCPHAIIVPVDMNKYAKHSEIVTQIIEDESPLYEKASIDEHYIDLTGMEKFYDVFEFCKNLKNKITSETGLPITFGLSNNKTIAKIATGEAKYLPEKYLYVRDEDIQSFLNPLSIKKIPMLGPKAQEILNRHGIETIEQLSKASPNMLQNILGKNGLTVWEKANGIDNTPVVQDRIRKSLGSEETFENDTKDIKFLNDLIIKITEELCYELRKMKFFTQCLTVKIKYSDFKSHTIQKTFQPTVSDNFLINIAKELFDKLYDKNRSLRLLGIRFSQFVETPAQLSLFGEQEENTKLYEVLDKIRSKFGNDAVGRASGR